MTKQKVQAWLDAGEKARDRKWLAAQLGVSFKTVEGWLSSGRPIPPPVQKLLARLMAPEVVLVVEFPPEVVETVKRAAALQGREWRDYTLRVVVAAAEKLLRAAPPAEPEPPADYPPTPRKRTRPTATAR